MHDTKQSQATSVGSIPCCHMVDMASQWTCVITTTVPCETPPLPIHAKAPVNLRKSLFLVQEHTSCQSLNPECYECRVHNYFNSQILNIDTKGATCASGDIGVPKNKVYLLWSLLPKKQICHYFVVWALAHHSVHVQEVCLCLWMLFDSAVYHQLAGKSKHLKINYKMPLNHKTKHDNGTWTVLDFKGRSH